MFRAMRFLHNAAESVGIQPPACFRLVLMVPDNFSLRSCNESQSSGILPGMRKLQSSRSRMSERLLTAKVNVESNLPYRLRYSQ